MDREEILEASRSENHNKDYAKIEIENRGVKIAAISVYILTVIYFCLEIFIKGSVNYGLYSIIALYCGIVYGYKALKLRKKYYTICSIIWNFVAIIFIYQYIRDMFFTLTII